MQGPEESFSLRDQKKSWIELEGTSKKPTRIVKVMTDVTNETSVDNLFKQAHKEFNDLDVELPIRVFAYMVGVDQ